VIISSTRDTDIVHLYMHVYIHTQYRGTYTHKQPQLPVNA